MKKFTRFNRVIINIHGDATTPERAKEMGITPDLGYLRDDGWSLGTPKELESVALKMWGDEYTHKILIGETHWTPLKGNT